MADSLKNYIFVQCFQQKNRYAVKANGHGKQIGYPKVLEYKIPVLFVSIKIT
jgi:hypothetical protein